MTLNHEGGHDEHANAAGDRGPLVPGLPGGDDGDAAAEHGTPWVSSVDLAQAAQYAADSCFSFTEAWQKSLARIADEYSSKITVKPPTTTFADIFGMRDRRPGPRRLTRQELRARLDELRQMDDGAEETERLRLYRDVIHTLRWAPSSMPKMTMVDLARLMVDYEEERGSD